VAQYVFTDSRFPDGTTLYATPLGFSDEPITASVVSGSATFTGLRELTRYVVRGQVAGRPVESRFSSPSDSAGSGGAGLPSNVLTKTANYTASAGDLVQADATGGGFTVTLPTAPATGALVTVKKTDSGTNVVTVAPAGGGTIDGDANATITTKNFGAVFEHVGSNVWKIVAPTSAGGSNGVDGKSAYDIWLAAGNSGSASAFLASLKGADGAIASVQDEGSNLTARGKLNFIGAGVTAADDAANGRTNITIPGPSAAPFSRRRSRSVAATPATVAARAAVRPPRSSASTTSRTCRGCRSRRWRWASRCRRLSRPLPPASGIYSSVAGLPGSLLVEATSGGALDCSTVGYKASGAISQAFTAGTVYWLALVAQGANVTLRSVSTSVADRGFTSCRTRRQHRSGSATTRIARTASPGRFLRPRPSPRRRMTSPPSSSSRWPDAGSRK
jgi:hypothetical protein